MQKIVSLPPHVCPVPHKPRSLVQRLKHSTPECFNSHSSCFWGFTVAWYHEASCLICLAAWFQPPLPGVVFCEFHEKSFQTTSQPRNRIVKGLDIELCFIAVCHLLNKFRRFIFADGQPTHGFPCAEPPDFLLTTPSSSEFQPRIRPPPASPSWFFQLASKGKARQPVPERQTGKTWTLWRKAAGVFFSRKVCFQMPGRRWVSLPLTVLPGVFPNVGLWWQRSTYKVWTLEDAKHFNSFWKKNIWLSCWILCLIYVRYTVSIDAV